MTQTVFTDSVAVQGSQDTPQLQVQANSTQNQPLQNWLDNSSNIKAQVTGDGRLQVGNNLGGGAPMDSLIQVNQDVTLPSSLPTSGHHTLGRLTGALSSAVNWVVHELQLLGTGGVSSLQIALRAKLTHSNTGTSTGAELRAGDFQTINQGGSGGAAVGQATGLRATASNGASAYLAKAVGVESALTNDTGGNLTEATAFKVVAPTNAGTIGTLYGLQIPDLTQGSANYALYTGAGQAHIGDNFEVKVQPTTPTGNPPTNFIKLYPKTVSSTPHLFAKDTSGTEYDLSIGSVASVGLSMPGEFSVANSPLTSSGTLTVTKTNQTAHTVYAGPSTGSPAGPTFRALVDADVPDALTISGGTIDNSVIGNTVPVLATFSPQVTVSAPALTNAFIVLTGPQYALIYCIGGTSYNKNVVFRTNTLNRFDIGTDGVDNFVVQRYDNAGTYIEQNLIADISTGVLTYSVRNAGTNVVLNAANFDYSTSGTPATGFGTGIALRSQDSTTPKMEQTRLRSLWATATHASRKARAVWSIYDTAERDVITIESNGSAPMIGFLGGAAVVKQSTYTQTYSTTTTTINPASTTAFTGLAAGQGGTPYAKLADLNTLRTDHLSLVQAVNQLIDDLQAYSLAA